MPATLQRDTKLPNGLLTRLRFGAGRFREAGPVAQELGSRALLVTTPRAMDALGYATELVEALESHGVRSIRFRDVTPNPTTIDVDAGARLAREFRSEMIIALGGGSAIDCAKAIAAVAADRRPATDYLFQKAQPGPATLPVIAIPTTAGTGSELNRSCIITDPTRRFKGGIRSNFLIPWTAIVDPRLTHSAGRELTAQTGFDALAHAIESYVSPRSNPEGDALALAAIRDVTKFLPVALKLPCHREARERLAFAAAMMGINLTSVGTCLPHRLDKPLTALHPHLPHGQAIALFYPAWLKWSIPGHPGRFARIAAIMEPGLRALPEHAQAAALPGIMSLFLARLGLLRSMGQLGIAPADLAEVARNAEGDIRMNPVPFDPDMLPGFLADVFSANACPV
jgi:alcohol dehydrogenase class IV